MSSEGTPLHGDRGAWNVITFDTEHARDIMDSTLRRHLPLPGAAGGYARSDGTDWQRVNSIALADLADYSAGFIIVGGAADWEAAAFDWDTLSAGAGADMVHGHGSPAEGGTLGFDILTGDCDLADLADYTQGDLIYGGAADWQDLAHPGAANRVLQSTAAEVGWSANAVTFPTAGAVPIGSGAVNQVAYWAAANTLAGDTGMTYVPATDALTIVGELDVGGHVALGNAAAPNAAIVAYIRDDVSINAGALYGVSARAHGTPTANFTTTYVGMMGRASLGTAQTQTSGALYGVIGRVGIDSDIAASLQTMGGMYGYVDVEDASCVTAYGILFYTPWVDTGSLTTGYGTWIVQGPVGAGSITTLYGLRIEAITAGGTNWAIYSAGGQSYHAGNFGIGATPSTRLDIGAGAMEFDEMAAPGAGAANTGRLYCKDNGAGKTQLIVKFSDAAEHVLATMA